MKKLIILFLLGILSLNLYADKEVEYKEGDVIFQVSTSSQSKLIQYATSSIWSHCGIIVYKNGEPYVLEASNVVKLTPLHTFLKRGRFGRNTTRRFINRPVKINYKQYLGIPYDSQFSLTNKRYYCSELVWIIYKRQFGIELCKPKSISEYRTYGLSKVMKKRGISSKSKFIAPVDILNSKK